MKQLAKIKWNLWIGSRGEDDPTMVSLWFRGKRRAPITTEGC